MLSRIVRRLIYAENNKTNGQNAYDLSMCIFFWIGHIIAASVYL
jgi:hypothetical protein